MTATHTTAYACTCGTDGTTTETKTGTSGHAVTHAGTCGATCTTLTPGFAETLAVKLGEVAR